MATVRVKFRRSTVPGKSGTVYYQICHRQNNKQITTKIHLQPDEWDGEREQIAMQCGSNRTLQMYRLSMEHDLQLLHRIIKELENRQTDYTLSDVTNRYHSSVSRVTVLDYMRCQIESLRKKRKIGTANNYQCALNSFSLFQNHEDLSFYLMNEELVLKYNDWLERREVTKNTVSFYMRIWRAVYNRAVREKLVEQTFPFQNVFTGIDRTRKRAADEGTVMKLLKLDLKDAPSLALTRDLFVFSYCTRGMAFVDMAFLKKGNIENDVLSYRRRKTGQLLAVRIEPCMADIINRYKSATAASPYLFPILTSENPEKAYVQYQNALSYHNRKLKRLAKIAGIHIPLSSYTPRHTWATAARNHNIPISVISAGMGHTSEKTTQIYLASLENSVIDDANRELLTELNRSIAF